MIKSNENNVISLIPKIQGKCHHKTFIVDHTLDVVVCEQCGEKVNPMWVLKSLTQSESRAEWRLTELQEKAKKDRETIEAARDKTRCKCQHCHKMTRIIRFKSL